MKYTTLTEAQYKALDGVRFIFSIKRGIGKSYLVAYVLVEKAVLNIGTTVSIVDHTSYRTMENCMGILIKGIFDKIAPENTKLIFKKNCGYLGSIKVISCDKKEEPCKVQDNV